MKGQDRYSESVLFLYKFLLRSCSFDPHVLYFYFYYFYLYSSFTRSRGWTEDRSLNVNSEFYLP